jgi:PAS domain S-box-containing protein
MAWRRLKAAWAALTAPAETGRAEPERHLDTLLTLVPAVIYVRSCDAKSTLSYVSGNVQALLGYSTDEILRTPRFWIDHIHADDRDRCLGSLDSLAQMGMLEMEYRLRAKDGSWRWLRDECRIVRGLDGHGREVVGSCIDVTGRHRSEQALARSEAELRAAQTRLMDALESSDDAFSVFDAHDRLVAFNSRYCAIYPTIADIIRPGVSFTELLRVSARRGQYAGITAEHADQWVDERLERHSHPGGIFEQLLGDGRWLEIVERPTAEGGRVAIRRDITGRKTIEAAIRDELQFKQSLIDALPFPVFYKNTDLIYVGCNGAFCDALGKSTGDIIGKTLTETYTAEKAAEFRARDQELLTQGGIQNYETTFRWGDGSLRQIAIVKATFNDPDGKVAGLIGTIIDLTPQKRAEEQMVQNARLATLGQIASEIAHEMNQPLSIMRMTAENSLERLKQGEVAADIVAGKLAIMVEQTGRMGEMIAHLRSFARTEENERQPVAPLPAIRSALALTRLRFQLDDIALAIHLPESCPDLIGRGNQLEQVVVALLTNARDAVCARHKPGKRRISLSLEQRGDDLILSVEDNGGGIPDDLWSRVFTPFFTTKTEGAGAGLGLSISANIVAAMGGRISGHNYGDGALFQVFWPCGGGPVPTAQSPAKAAMEPARRPRILVVDDEPLAVDCITDFLTARDYDVVAAISPLDALNLAADTTFDLVLTDQRMPGMDGNVLIERLRTIRPDLPAIMMSGGSMPMPSAGKGPTAQLPKPLVLDELGRKIAQLLAPRDVEATPLPSPPAAEAPPFAPAAETPPLAMAATGPAQRLWLMGELTATLAHDFGQPINIIRLNAENALDNLAEKRLSDDRLRRALTSTVEQCQRMQDFALHLVATTRRPSQPASRMSALPALRAALAAIQDRIRMQAIAFSWHTTAKLPPVLGHAPRLQDAFAQILTNACDALAAEAVSRHAANPPWLPRLSVSCGADGDNRGIIVTIADNGPGIPQSVQDGLRDGSLRSLGLPIAAGIVAEMGGSLDIECDCGGKITIRLPTPPRRLFLAADAAPLAVHLAAWGWVAETSPDQADAALLAGPWSDVLAALPVLGATVADLPVVVIAAADETQARQAVAAGAMMVIAADAPPEEIAACLNECIQDTGYA